MTKKFIRSEADLSYADAEAICDIVDKQLRQHHNVEHFKKICKDTQESNFYKKLACGLGAVILFIVTTVSTTMITNRIDNYYFNNGSGTGHPIIATSNESFPMPGPIQDSR